MNISISKSKTTHERRGTKQDFQQVYCKIDKHARTAPYLNGCLTKL